MAMEKHYVIRDTHNRPITALGYNPTRREILVGCEDGMVKMWETESGKLVQTCHDHKGWVTDFLYWPEAKVVLSSSNDGYIICWGSGGGLVDKIMIGLPIYCMTINPRRRQLLCGAKAAIKVYNLDLNKKSHHYVNNKSVFSATEHTDIVRCIVCQEARVYSAGYDHQLIIYDSSYTAEDALTAIHINSHAHNAGISCLQLVKDNENSTWILTGSFDKTVKIWTTDGKLVHPPLKNFISPITGVCFVKQNKTIWAAGGMAYASLYDPKSGDNVSDFIGTFETETERYQLQILKYFSEQNQVVGSTSRRHLVVWKYNPSGCITALKCPVAIESLTYTKKLPLLIFSGDTEGVITKWERVASNHFMYSKEVFPASDMNVVHRRKKPDETAPRETPLSDQVTTRNPSAKKRWFSASKRNISATKRNYSANKRNFSATSCRPSTGGSMANKPQIPENSSFEATTGILKVVFVEKYDFIIAAGEDGNIYVWGFDDVHVEVLNGMKPTGMDELVHKYAILLNPESTLLPHNAETKKKVNDSVTNRVAGFICKHILSEHSSSVTSLAIVGCDHGYKTTYLVSAGWDRRICIWDLETGRLHDVLRNQSSSSNLPDTACDGIITDMVFSAARHQLAYASADKMVYVRTFSPSGAKMLLQGTLQGHTAEVTCVVWNDTTETWVTGSEDATIRVWAADGANECLQVLSTHGSVSALTIDLDNGAIIAAILDQIRVYDSEQYTTVQTNTGHTDSVRSIIHIPERKQYVTASWDKTIRVWNSWVKKPSKKWNIEKSLKGQDSIKSPTIIVSS